jgi:nucleoside-diphosphate-sugar epimerase
VRRAEARGVTAFEQRPVLVIGGFGFIGVNLCDRLSALGARVTIATRSVARHRAAAAEVEARGTRVVEGDLRDRAAMREAVAGQDVVFNLAGQSGAVRSMEDPLTDLDGNCRGNLVLLEALREQNQSARLVFVSSRLVYGRVGADPVTEDRLPDPTCMHAVHKRAVEQYLHIYGQVYGLSCTIARMTNPYGPGQPSDRTAYGVVNRMIHQALAGDRIPVYGDGRQQRDYIYIDDAVTALLNIAESPAAIGKTYNVGSGIGTPLVEMARAIAAIAGGGRLEMLEWPQLAERIETGDFVADIGRIRRELGWEPRVSLAEGLQRTVAFYRAHAA